MKFIQLTRMHFGPDHTMPKERRVWINLDKIVAINVAERTHLMHGVNRVYTHIYTVDDAGKDNPWSVTQTPEDIFRIIDLLELDPCNS